MEVTDDIRITSKDHNDCDLPDHNESCADIGSEEREAQRQYQREWRARRHSQETPEERETRLKRAVEYQRRRREAMTPEQREAAAQKWRRASMSPEQVEILRERDRNRRHKAHMTQEQWETHLKDKRERRRKENMTPEQWEAKLAYQRGRQANMTDEQREKRNTYCREQNRVDKDLAEFVDLGEASRMLGVRRDTVLHWIKTGKLVGEKIGYKWRFRREEIDNMAGMKVSADKLFLWKSTVGFDPPAGFHVIRNYKSLTEYSEAFAAGKISFLLMVGSPGSGKSRQIKADMEGRTITWIDNHVTNLGLYCSVFEAKGCPVVLDDVNHFLQNKLACSLLKALTQTEKTKSVSWESPTKLLEERYVPRQYETTSPICMIGNMWDASNADFAAIQDRALPVAFFPSAETIHNRVIELGWCDTEVVDFIGRNLSEIPQPSMREYYMAQSYKGFASDWREKMLAIWRQV